MSDSSPQKTIAVVEDNFDNRLLLRAFLRKHFALKDYETGAQALAAWQEEAPDVILLDISLPDMDGTEVLQRVRADETLASVPVIAFTAHAMFGDRERFLDQGFNDYVTKPILDFNELIETLHRVIEDATP